MARRCNTHKHEPMYIHVLSARRIGLVFVCVATGFAKPLSDSVSLGESEAWTWKFTIKTTYFNSISYKPEQKDYLIYERCLGELLISRITGREHYEIR